MPASKTININPSLKVVLEIIPREKNNLNKNQTF